MAETHTGQLSDITISEEMGYGEKVARGLPVAGGARHGRTVVQRR